MSEVEFVASYAKTVKDLPEAWSFIMEYVDQVGATPFIQITPFITVSREGNEEFKFQALVQGQRDIK